MKKILIACPTSSHKDYCLDEWVENIFNIYKQVAYIKENNMPKYRVYLFIVDNSQDNKNFYRIKEALIKERLKSRQGLNFSLYYHYNKDISLRELMSECNNLITEFCIEIKADYLLSIESDVFPNDVVERLLKHNPNSKKIVALPYFLYNSIASKSIMFDMEDIGDNRLCVPVDTDRLFMLTDGKLHEAQQLGLGCAMIHRSILKQIPFRVDKNDKTGSHPDSFFYDDCRAKGIKLYFDTSAYVIHKNGSWKNIKYME